MSAATNTINPAANLLSLARCASAVRSRRRPLPPGVFGSEAVYAPKAGATREDAEDDGYVMTLVTNSRDWSSHCLVFDATDVAAGPMARVTLPQRVPFGFHASWAPGI